MKTITAAVLLALSAHAAPEPGRLAPDFTLTDHVGKPRTLSGSRGKFVVLEWFNKGCPFVRKHYGLRNMQGLQSKYVKKGVIWYSIVSSKPGKQGYLTAREAQAAFKAEGMGATAILLDPKGDVGRLYGAKTTPHMFVVDPKGSLVYAGAIDDKATADPEDIKPARNFVAAALDESMAGKPVSTPSSTPYGCSVKY